MRINKRQFLAGLGLASVANVAVAGNAHASQRSAGDLPISLADLRGTANANEFGLRPGIVDDQSRSFQTILNEAARHNKPVFLPPGNYNVSNLILPAHTRLMGVPGASRLVYSGNGHLLIAEDGEHIELTGIVLDGANRELHDYAEAAIRIVNTGHVVIDNCQIIGSNARGLQVERSSGRLERNRISGCAGDAAIYSLENSGMAITGNDISDCYGAGIRVHRWQKANDRTSITNNRISRIGLSDAAPNEARNGIHLFRADGCNISGNQLDACPFDAIHVTESNQVQISGNSCLQSGNAGIYCDSGSGGLMVTANMIDGGRHGITFDGSKSGDTASICANNLVRNITSANENSQETPDGTGISAKRNVTLNSNVVENAARYGLQVGWGAEMGEVIATGNIIRNAPVGIYVSVVEGAGSAQIAENVISETIIGSVVGYRWNEAVTEDLAKNATSGFSHLMVSRNRTG